MAAWLALFVVSAAAVLALRLAVRRATTYRTLQAAALLGIALGAVLITIRYRTAGARVVFIRDVAAGGSFDDGDSERFRTLRSAFGARVQVVSHSVLVLAAESPAGSKCPVADAEWNQAAPVGPLPGADCALHAALDLFEARSVWQRIGDWLAARGLRIVIWAERSGRWAVTARGEHPPLAVETARALAAGVRIDVVEPEADDEAARAPPMLTLEVPRFASPGAAAAGTWVDVKLENLPPARRGQTVTYRRACTLDRGITALEHSFVETAASAYVDGEGTAVERVSLGGLLGPLRGVGLLAGIHLLRCEVTLAGSDAALAADAFLRALRRRVIVSSAATDTFVAMADATKLAQLVAIRGDLFHAGTGSWPREVRIDTMTASGVEAFLQEQVTRIRAAGSSVQLPPDVEWPVALVLHDFSTEWYQLHCVQLDAVVRAGLTLFVSGLPAELQGTCPMMATVAKPETAEDGGTTTLVYDRTPRVLVSFDPSRLGLLVHDPTEVGKELLRPEGAVPKSADLWQRQRDIVAALKLPAGSGPISVLPPARGSTPAEDACGMMKQSALGDRLGALLDEPKRELRIDQVVVAFVYEAPQPGSTLTTVAQLLDRGYLVAWVRLPTKFASGLLTSTLDAPAGCASLSAQQVFWPKDVDTSLWKTWDALASGGELTGAISRAEAKRRFKTFDLSAAPAASIDAIVRDLKQLTSPHFDPRHVVVAPLQLGRHIDPRAGPLLTPAGEDPADAGSRWASPRRFQELQPGGGGGFTTVYAAAIHSAHDPTRLEPRPLLVGWPYGSGQVLAADYSVFEGVTGTPPGATGDPHRRLMPPLKQLELSLRLDDAWGLRRIADVAATAWNLEPTPGPEPRLLELARDATTGRLGLVVLQQIEASRQVRRFQPFRTCRDDAFVSNCPGTEVSAPLVLSEVDIARQRLAFELMPKALGELCGERASCVISVAGIPTVVDTEGARGATVAANLRAREVLPALARFTGGTVAKASGLQDLGVTRVPMRLPAVLLVLFSTTTLLLLRLGRRLVAYWSASNQASAEARHAASSTEGAAALGDVFGRPTPQVKMGAPGGVRPLEPGDNLANMLVDDLFLLSHGEAVGVPRVMRRIEERSRRLVFLVNVGSSMRSPSWSDAGPLKLLAAARAIETIAHVAWRSTAEVSVFAHSEGPLVGSLGPMWVAPAAGTIARFLVASHGAARPFPHQPTLPELVDGSTLIEVSDFITADLGVIPRRAAEIEESRGQLGGVMIESPSDDALLDVGWAGSARLLCDRSEVTAGDLAVARQALRDEVAQAFAQTEAGVCVLGTQLNAEEMLIAIAQHPLAGVLQ